MVLDPNGGLNYAEMEEARDFAFLTAQCSKSAYLLPPVPVELVLGTTPSSPAPISSLADELKKVSDLRSSGALTREEFEAAKRRLLGQ